MDVEEIDDALFNLIDDRLMPSSKVRIINLKYFAQYSPDAGFRVSIDGLHNMPDKGPFIVLYNINHPNQNLDQVLQDPLQLQLNSSLDWSSPLNSPAFIEGYMHYKKIKPHKAAHLIIDIRRIKYVKKKGVEYPVEEPYAWTILPLFTYDEYINSGIYQLSLFKGASSLSILKSIRASTEPWQKMMECMREIDFETKKPLLEYLYPASAVVRLIDGQREVRYILSIGSLSNSV